MDNTGLKRGDLKLEDYNTNYSDIYNEEKKNLEKILAGKYVSIEHVGSTAIKNIKSKPIIDILVTCKDIEEFTKFAKEHVANDIYSVKEDSEREDLLIRKEEDGKVKAFIHVVNVDSQVAKNYILFRDYLNSNNEEAKKYEKLKLELLKKYKDDRKSYTAGKENYIKEVIEKSKKKIR